jgi:hypothetical protein
VPRAKAQAAGGSFPDSPHSHLSSRVSVHSSSKLARCRIRQLLLRISTDSPSISPTIPPLLLFENAEVGERLLSHSSLGSWSTPSLSKLAVSDQDGAVLQGRPRRAEPTLPRWSLLIKPCMRRPANLPRNRRYWGATCTHTRSCTAHTYKWFFARKTLFISGGMSQYVR